MNWKPPNALAARVEEACLNAWPALQEIHYDGWLIRLADGQTRRTNSVNILSDGSLPVAAKVEYCEDIYRRHGLATYFRILSTAGDTLDALLEARGYDAQDETSTLFMDFDVHAPPRRFARAVELTKGQPNEEWLSARGRMAGQSESEAKKVEKILQQLALPAVFAAVRDEGGVIRSVAKGAVHDQIACLNLVVTDPAFRQRGYAQDCVAAILRWAADDVGARAACLQVVSANTAAMALYEKLGFSQELYCYHYRHHAFAGE